MGGFSIVTLTGLVSLAGTSVCLDQATLSRVENVLCHCSPATSCSGTQDWCTLAALVWSSSGPCRPPCARLPLRVHGAERQGVSRGSEAREAAVEEGWCYSHWPWQANGTKGQLSQRGRSTFKPVELTEEQKRLI